MQPLAAVILTAVAVIVLILIPAECCNEALCASVVSKCMLTQSCKCDLSTCSCCKECFNCLNHLYTECCSCVEMCPRHNETDNSLSKKSHVEDFPEPIPRLFNALTEEPDPLERWVSHTYPIDLDATPFHVKLNKELKYHGHPYSFEHNLTPTKDIVMMNCTVLFISQCVSWNKCKMVCHTMGSSSYRWFHDGCCECIGPTCINYGISESRCTNCPFAAKDLLYEEESSPSYVYDSSKEEYLPNEQTLK
ncbi:twisted gastrulation protein homolog 1-A [Anabrus simplex]|uniref:twisted gastrulation protein homolog 1-A n=1 Tax=Anabrus simplex TaxID=316456 RepID=UPI0034DDA40D